MTNLAAICIDSLRAQACAFSSSEDPSNVARSCSILSKWIDVNIITANIRNYKSVSFTTLAQVIFYKNLVSLRVYTFIRSKTSNQLRDVNC